MNIIEHFIKRPVTVTMIVSLLLFLGILSYLNTQVDLLPDISVPSLAIVTYFPNATAQKIEESVTTPLEQVLNTVKGIKEMRSISREEESVIVLKLDWDVKLEFATMEAREKVRLIDLPEGCYVPSIQRWDASAMPVFRFDLSGPFSQAELYQLAKNKVVPRIERIPGVGAIDIYGGNEKEIKVKLQQTKLAHYGLSFFEIVTALSNQNNNLQVGELDDEKSTYAIRTIGKYSSLEDLLNTVVKATPGSIIRLREIASIEEVSKEQRYIARLNGQDSVAVAVHRTKGGNTVNVIGKIKSEIKTLRTQLPPGIKINISRDDSIYIFEAQSFASGNLYMSILCTMFVLYLFLRNWRPTIIIGITIPIALIATFIILKQCSLTRNVLSLAGLALATGMIVDSSIVVLENIIRHMKMGRSLYDACISGTTEVRTSVLASNFTTLAVFVPLLWIKGLANELFRDLSITVISALAFSLVVGFLVIPVLAYKLLQDPMKMSYIKSISIKSQKKSKNDLLAKMGNKFVSKTRDILNFLLTNPKWSFRVLLATFLVCGISFVFLPSISFIPQGVAEEIKIDLKLPEGVSLQETDDRVKKIEGILQSQPFIDTISTTIQPAEAEIFAKLKSNKSGRFDIVETIRQKICVVPGIKFKIAKIDKVTSAGGLGDPVELKITGKNLEEMSENSKKIFNEITLLPGLADLQITGTQAELSAGLSYLSMEELQINIDKEKTSRLGINSNYVASTIAGYIYGRTATKYGHDLVDVRVIGQEQDLRQNIGGLLIGLPAGRNVSLNSIADFKKFPAQKRIEHIDQQKASSINMNIKPGYVLGKIIHNIESVINLRVPELSDSCRIMGVSKNMTESFSQLKYSLIISVILIYLVMAAQFESFLYPFVIIFTLPLASIGVVAGLLIAGEPLTLPAMIGIIMLGGIAVNNGIILIDFINILRQRGVHRKDAIVEAVTTRIQPIFITTLTTILGMVPLAFGMGAGAELYRGLAVVIVGGLLSSTLLTILIIPVIYVVLEDAISFVKLSVLKLRLQTNL